MATSTVTQLLNSGPSLIDFCCLTSTEVRRPITVLGRGARRSHGPIVTDPGHIIAVCVARGVSSAPLDDASHAGTVCTCVGI